MGEMRPRLLCALLLLIALPAAAQFVSVTASQVGAGAQPAGVTWTACLTPTGVPSKGFHVGSTGQAVGSATCRDVQNGVILNTLNGVTLGPLQVADGSLSAPTNPCENYTVRDDSGSYVIGTASGQFSGYGCVQFAANNSFCSSGACNLDNYIPTIPNQPLGQSINNLTVMNLDITGTCYGCSNVGTLWGHIGGTLSSQTDLQNALNAKEAHSALATVAESGSYNDLSNKPSAYTLPAASAGALGGVFAKDCSQLGAAYVVQKINTDGSETCVLVASGGGGTWGSITGTLSDQTDLSNALGAKEAHSALATVAESGSYSDLTSKPSIPAAQIQSDWNEANNALLDFIKNKPSIPSGPPYAESDITSLTTDLSGKQPSLGFTPENVANKDTTTTLGTSDTKYPSQNAVKSYVDTGLGGKQNSLGFTPEDAANKDTTTSLGTSDTKYPSQNAVKSYVDGHKAATAGNADTATNVSTNGTANQVWGMNGGATAQGWQTVSGGGGSSVPALTGLTWVNQTSDSVTASAAQAVVGGPIMMTVPRDATLAWRFLMQAAPSTPFKFIAQMRCLRVTWDVAGCGIAFRDSSSGHIEQSEYIVGVGGYNLRVEKLNSPSSDNSTPVIWAANDTQFSSFSSPQWLQIRDDGTTLYFDASPDGTNFINMFSEAVGTFLTPNQLGFEGLDNGGDGKTLYDSILSWTVVGNATL
jgi:hypothetical protein